MRSIITLLTLLISVFTYSQVGIGTPTPNESAEVEIKSAKKGILIPRIALKTIDDTTTIEKGNVNSLLIFNTTDEGDLKPGYYYWFNDRWQRMINQSDEALKTPWKIQATDSIASQNTQNIYQQGKVAVGFTKNDSLSNKQLEVKGDFKFIDKTSHGYYNWFESDIDLTPSGGGIDEDLTMNIFGSFEEPDFNALYSNAAAMYTRLGKGDNGEKESLLAFLSTTERKYSSQFYLSSGTGGSGQKANFSLSSMDTETNSSSGIVGSSQNIILSALKSSNQSHLLIDPQKGGIMFTNRADQATESYIFPRTKGTKHQVLTVGDPANPATAQNTNQLVWKDFSDLVSQPWKIQATDSIASQNTQNIYQQGKVAVGFTKNDSLSNKQLEVKGDVRFLSEKKIGTNSIYNLIETNNFLGADQGPYNFFITSNKPSLLENPELALGFITDPMHGVISRLFSKHESINANIETNANNRGQIRLYAEDGTNDQVRIEGDQLHGLRFYVKKKDKGNANIQLQSDTGVEFSFKENNSLLEESYIFPRTKGNKNQILTVGDPATLGNTNKLEWKDFSDLVSQPWKIQATDSIASQNTQNIYQQGKVAVGFTKNDSLSNKQFDVKGDFKFIDKTAHGYYNWLESDVDLTSLGAAENLTMNIFGSFEEPDFNALNNNAAAMYTGLEKGDNGEKASTLGFLSITDEKYSSQFYLNSGTGGVPQKANFSLSSIDKETKSSSGILGSSKNLVLSTQDNSNQSHLFIDPQRGGIMFTNRVDQATATESYIFPRTKGNKNQVLTVGDPATEFNTNKLEWKDLADLVAIHNTTAGNGITINSTNNNVELGGTLERATEIVTAQDKTLAIKGLQNSTASTDKIMMVDATTGVVKTKDIESLIAGPKYFYAPSIVLPINASNLPDYVTESAGTFTVDLHENVYAAQFGMTDNTTSVKSPGATTLPIIDANKLEYFITYFDKTVFTDVAVNEDGLLTYKIASGAVITEKTYMNIVFKVK